MNKILIFNWVIVILFLNNCSDNQQEIGFIDDPSVSYEYLYNKNGVLKLVRGENSELILYNCAFKKIDMIDNFAYNLNYDVVNWSKDTLEINIVFEQSEWESFKGMFYRLQNESSFIGNYVIKFGYIISDTRSTGASESVIVDSIKVDSNCSSIHLFYQGHFIESTEITQLYFSNGSLFYFLKSGENVLTKEIELSGNLKKQDILKKIFERYREVYCK